jgi:PAS domain-containing protein
MLVSVTDPQDRITSCNPVFVRISGDSVAELLGQPYNIARHPDLPDEAFRDLWDTVQSGRRWTALVKNRGRNGDFDGVRGNAAPLTDGYRITGELSVRTRPDPAEVQAADALDARMRAEAVTGTLQLRLRHGRLVGGVLALAGEIRREVAGVRGSVQGVKAGNLDLSARTEARASSLQQTTSAMAQITGTVRQSAESAVTGSQLAAQTAEVAAGSDAAVRALVQRRAASARQIHALIDESSACVETGTVQSNAARERMHEALAAVRSVSALLGEVSSGARHQEQDTRSRTSARGTWPPCRSTASPGRTRPWWNCWRRRPRRWVPSSTACACSACRPTSRRWARWTPWRCAARVRLPRAGHAPVGRQPPPRLPAGRPGRRAARGLRLRLDRAARPRGACRVGRSGVAAGGAAWQGPGLHRGGRAGAAADGLPRCRPPAVGGGAAGARRAAGARPVRRPPATHLTPRPGQPGIAAGEPGGRAGTATARPSFCR